MFLRFASGGQLSYAAESVVGRFSYLNFTELRRFLWVMIPNENWWDSQAEGVRTLAIYVAIACTLLGLLPTQVDLIKQGSVLEQAARGHGDEGAGEPKGDREESERSSHPSPRPAIRSATERDP